MQSIRFRRHLMAGAASLLVLAGTVANAQGGARRDYTISAQDLDSALREAARQSGREILFSSASVAGRSAPALQGRYTVEEAVRRLLHGTNLEVSFEAGGIVIREQAREQEGQDGASAGQTGSGEAGGILVTGSRIAGSTPFSPTITLKQREIADAGFNNLGDLIRSIPQNYSGGQNPTVAGGGNQGAANQNTTSSSALNLRGVGADATLTLLNGHRMPYDAVRQGIDISAIPLAAIDRIEVVTDGASAIYGSDAIAGVANIILKRSFKGAQASVRFGLATDGGYEQQQYSLVGGGVWNSGGVVITGDFSRSTNIVARDRKFTRNLDPSASLVPMIRQFSSVLSGYQRIRDDLRFDFDATYSHRRSETHSPSTTTASYLTAGALIMPRVKSFSVSPSLRWAPAAGWEVYASGTYGESRASVVSTLYSAGTQFLQALVDYDNTLKSAEAGASGRLFSLPGGPLQLAVGIGFRSNTLDAFTRTVRAGSQTVGADFRRGRDSSYAFAEARLPLVEPQNDISLVHRLTFSGALRYEDYGVVGKVTTPKFGMLYAPSEDMDIKVSWGQSFKAATLNQQFQQKFVALRLATAYGASGFPAGATVLDLAGGNPDDLDPERADSLSSTLAIHPRALPDALIELSYFNVRYKDRIIAPIASSLGLLSNPIYSNLITFNPTSAQIAAALAGAPAGVSNEAGTPFDPARVIAIVNGLNRNSASQSIEGVDISLRYRFVMAGGGRLTLLASTSYLESEQVLIEGQPTVDLAGTIFNAPHWRARGGFQWEDGGLTITSFVNHVGGNEDRRTTPIRPVGSLTTVDAALTYRVEESNSVLDGLELSLAASNLLNTPPDRIRQTLAIDPTYDSTNYSPVGRFISFTVRKTW